VQFTAADALQQAQVLTKVVINDILFVPLVLQMHPSVGCGMEGLD
jgi:hypothetical protein